MPPRVRKLTSAAALAEHERRGERFAFLSGRLANVRIEEVWAVLERELTLGDGRASAERILRALDGAEANLRRAGMLLQAAIEEFDEFELHFRAAYSEWGWTAREALERAKKGQRLSGHVTVEMVEDWVAAHIPDYRKWRERRRAYERTKNLAKQLYEAWQSRGASLRKQADLAMSRRGVDTSLLPRRGEGKEDRG